MPLPQLRHVLENGSPPEVDFPRVGVPEGQKLLPFRLLLAHEACCNLGNQGSKTNKAGMGRLDMSTI